MSFTFLSFLFVVVGLGLAFVRTRMAAYKLSRLDWEDLVAKLEPVPINEISAIALDYLNPRKDEHELDTTALWAMIGEAEGLRRIYANGKVMIALANYAERWNRSGSLVVTERMRRDAVTLRRATLRLYLGVAFGYDGMKGPFCVQEVASAYFLMRGRVLKLYETSHAGRLPRLVAAL